MYALDNVDNSRCKNWETNQYISQMMKPTFLGHVLGSAGCETMQALSRQFTDVATIVKLITWDTKYIIKNVYAYTSIHVS